MPAHSCTISPKFKGALAHVSEGKYGRMFPDLPPLEIDETFLCALGRSGASMDLASDTDGGGLTDNPRIPAGFAFFGQFIAHDITRDPSLLHHHMTTKKLRNFRTPALDLEVIYGAGSLGNPYFYDAHDQNKFFFDPGRSHDVPRNSQGQALIADPRDDVHVIISQLHLAFLKFHNRIVDELQGRGIGATALFEEARRLAAWHYQWIVVHEFLGLSVGAAVVDDILTEGHTIFAFADHPYIPMEFADAAYRFGHAQVRATYQLNARAGGFTVFPDLAGGRPVAGERAVDWTYFFAMPNRPQPQASKRLTTTLVHSLMDLPETVTGPTEQPEERSLAYRDLERGLSCGLPSGEAVARRMDLEPLSTEEVGLRTLGWRGETPLWYYILREAEVRTRGERLGAVGGRIVAEVLLGLLEGDAHSYRNVEPDWRPTLPAARPGEFTMADLLSFAGAV